MALNQKLVMILSTFMLSSQLSAINTDDHYLTQNQECRSLQINVGSLLNYAQFEYGCEFPERGALVGLHFDFQHIKLQREYLAIRFDGRWNAGSITNCFQEKTKIRDYRTELDLGYNHTWCDEDMRITPFAGVGFFYFEHDACHELNNRYYNIFIPLGFKYQWIISSCFRWGMEAEYRLDAWTRVKIEEKCDSVCERAKLHPRTQGLQIEIPFTWRAQERCEKIVQVKLIPFFDWNRFGRSCNDSCSCACPCSVLCPLDSCEPTSRDISRLNQWYVGAHLDFGIHF